VKLNNFEYVTDIYMTCMYVFTDVYMRIHIGVDLGEAVEL